MWRPQTHTWIKVKPEYNNFGKAVSLGWRLLNFIYSFYRKEKEKYLSFSDTNKERKKTSISIRIKSRYSKRFFFRNQPQSFQHSEDGWNKRNWEWGKGRGEQGERGLGSGAGVEGVERGGWYKGTKSSGSSSDWRGGARRRGVGLSDLGYTSWRKYIRPLNFMVVLPFLSLFFLTIFIYITLLFFSFFWVSHRSFPFLRT